jgi:hypothetical protein
MRVEDACDIELPFWKTLTDLKGPRHIAYGHFPMPNRALCPFPSALCYPSGSARFPHSPKLFFRGSKTCEFVDHAGGLDCRECLLFPATGDTLLRESRVEAANRYGGCVYALERITTSDRPQGPWQLRGQAPSGNNGEPIPVPMSYLGSHPYLFVSPFRVRFCDNFCVPLPPSSTMFARALPLSDANCWTGPSFPTAAGQAAANVCQEKNGPQLCGAGGRKRWMGGRSRTLAPPRGAAWIVDRSRVLWLL